MNQQPQVVIDARETANTAADAHQAGWDELQEIESPTYLDIERWVGVRKRFYAAQEKFEERLRQALAL